MPHFSAGRSPSPSQVGFSLFGAASAALSRRTILRGTALGAGALAIPGALAACGSSNKNTNTGGGTGGKTVTFGSNASDAVPKAAYEQVFKAYETKSGK